MRNWFNRWRPIWLACFVAGYVLTALVRLASGSDYTVTRGTTIASERPIWLLTVEMGIGAISDVSSFGQRGLRIDGCGVRSTSLIIDGTPETGIGGMARAAGRLISFIVWNADGTIERRTRATVRGHSVTIDDHVENGRVWVRVVIGPPLGDRRVRCAVLELKANEDDRHDTSIALSCSAVLDLPFRCRFVRRVAERSAGGPLREQCEELALAGRSAVNAGHDALAEIVRRFIAEVCR